MIKLKKKFMILGVICLTIISASKINIFADGLDSDMETPGFDVRADKVTVSEEKIESYKRAYKETFGTEEGFNEEEIQANAKELMNMSHSLDNAYSRQMIPKYFEKIRWITRNGVVSLSIYPTWAFSSKNYGYSYLIAMAEESWGIIVRNYSSNSKWKNTLSLKQQYKCHVLYARNAKTPWNIEPHRTETNFKKVVYKGCNP